MTSRPIMPWLVPAMLATALGVELYIVSRIDALDTRVRLQSERLIIIETKQFTAGDHGRWVSEKFEPLRDIVLRIERRIERRVERRAP